MKPKVEEFESDRHFKVIQPEDDPLVMEEPSYRAEREVSTGPGLYLKRFQKGPMEFILLVDPRTDNVVSMRRISKRIRMPRKHLMAYHAK